MVIEGYSGCGKTYLLKEIVAWLKKFNKINEIMTDNPYVQSNVILCATTNKAAEVMQKATGTVAGTIHSVIGVKPTPNYATGKDSLRPTAISRNHLNEDTYIFIDESSGIGSQLMYYIEKYCEKCTIVFLGDPAQTTAVKDTSAPIFTPDFVKRDFKASLKETIRFGNDTAINQIGTIFRDAVSTGRFKPIIPIDSSVRFVTKEEGQQIIQHEYLSPNYSQDKIRLLAYKNDTVLEFNNAIHRAKNPNKPYLIEGDSYISNSCVIQNQKVIVFNEQVITVSEIKEEGTLFDVPYTEIYARETDSTLRVITDHEAYKKGLKALARKAKKGESWVDYYTLKDGLVDLRLPYASTVHKAQGSTYKKVIIDLADIGSNYKSRRCSTTNVCGCN